MCTAQPRPIREPPPAPANKAKQRSTWVPALCNKRGCTLTSLSMKSNVAKTTTAKVLSALNLHFVLPLCQECVKVDPVAGICCRGLGPLSAMNGEADSIDRF